MFLLLLFECERQGEPSESVERRYYMSVSEKAELEQMAWDGT